MVELMRFAFAEKYTEYFHCIHNAVYREVARRGIPDLNKTDAQKYKNHLAAVQPAVNMPVQYQDKRER